MQKAAPSAASQHCRRDTDPQEKGNGRRGLQALFIFNKC